ncbi:MAG: NAD-dependent epimerase/dehydratase family protein, partial [Acidimicrobiia bacterium]
MTTLVTGASGVVGRALLKQLVSPNRHVRALVRSDEAAAIVAKLGAHPTRGDLLDFGSLAKAIDGCNVVYHVAGSNEMCLTDPSALFRVNVDGSRNMLRAAAAAGVKRMVYTSSATTLG